MRLVPFVLALVVLAVMATSAGAAPASPAKAQDLCGVGKGIWPPSRARVRSPRPPARR